MGEELVDGSSTSEYANTEEDGEDCPPSYSSQFEKVFPWYLSIGMSPSQFWDKDCQLARFYREAERHREDAFNRKAHLQGLYIYEALCDVSPIMVAFPEKGAKPLPYPEKPYELSYETEEVNKEEEILSPEDRAMEINKAKMEAFMVSFNQSYEKKSMKEEMTNG